MLTLDSTVLTRDLHLHNLFCHAEKLVQPQIGAMPPETETCKILKAAHAIQSTTLIQYLPTILNQLFEILVSDFFYWFYFFLLSDINLNLLLILIFRPWFKDRLILELKL